MAKDKNELVFLPLGGCGEIGMNLNLYGFGPPNNRKWIIVDLGVTFGSLETPGVDIIMPDISFLEDKTHTLLGIVLTHGHEDHMGALARLWPQLNCPVYATPFTKWLCEDRLSEAGLLEDVELHEIPLNGRFQLGDFDIELISLTHSIPEPNALAVRTPLGLIYHTGDWKIDPDPMIGGVDDEMVKGIGKEGVLAMVCDSTNVFSRGTSGSEGQVRKELIKLLGEYEGRGMAVAAFASNVARLESVMIAANQNDRSVCLLGRSMHRMVAAAKSVGLLQDAAQLIDEEQATQMPAGNVLYLCTGSQGEPRAALARIARGEHRYVKFAKNDVVVFSSKIIPGNEKSIFALHNMLAEQGVEVITEKARPIHVSGHPCRDELKQMYEWARPKISIPVHGERMHLLEHEKLARSLGIHYALAPHNGEMVKLSPTGAQIVDIVPSGRLYEDGGFIIRADDPAMGERRKMAYSGHVSVCMVIDERGNLIAGPEPRASGFPHGPQSFLLEEFLDEIVDMVEREFLTMRRMMRKDPYEVEKLIVAKVKKLVRERSQKRTLVEAIVLQV